LGQGTFASQSPIACPKRQLPNTLGASLSLKSMWEFLNLVANCVDKIVMKAYIVGKEYKESKEYTKWNLQN
jgi:hypothetical protein